MSHFPYELELEKLSLVLFIPLSELGENQEHINAGEEILARSAPNFSIERIGAMKKTERLIPEKIECGSTKQLVYHGAQDNIEIHFSLIQNTQN